MSWEPYRTAYVRPEHTPSGQFTRFHVVPEPMHIQNGYWRFANEGDDDVRAFNLGYLNPEQILLAAASDDGQTASNYSDILLSWISGQLEPYQTTRVGSATSHITAIIAEKGYLKRTVSFRGCVPVYPVDNERKLLVFREQFNAVAAPAVTADIPILPRPTTLPVSSSPYSHHQLQPGQSVFATPAHETSAPDPGHPNERLPARKSPHQTYKYSPLDPMPVGYSMPADYLQQFTQPRQPSPYTPQSLIQGLETTNQIASPQKDLQNELNQLRRLPSVDSSRGSTPGVLPSPTTERPYESPYAPVSGSRDTNSGSNPTLQKPHVVSPIFMRNDPEILHVEILQIAGNQHGQSEGSKAIETSARNKTGSPTEAGALKEEEGHVPSGITAPEDVTIVDKTTSSRSMKESAQTSTSKKTNVTKETNAPSRITISSNSNQANEKNSPSAETTQVPAPSQLSLPVRSRIETEESVKSAPNRRGCLPDVNLADTPDRPLTNCFGEAIDVSDSPFYKTDDTFSTKVLLLSEEMPCFVCGGTQAHEWDCLVTNFLPEEPPDLADIQALADATERNDPDEPRQQGMLYGLAYAPAETDEAQEGILSFADIIKNEESYKNDRDLQRMDLTDEPLVMAWALRQSTNFNAVFMLPNGEFECPPGFEHLWDDEEEQEGQGDNGGEKAPMSTEGGNNTCA